MQAQAVRLYIPTYERVLSRQLLLPCRRRRADSAQVLRPERGGAWGPRRGPWRGERVGRTGKSTGGYRRCVCVYCTVLHLFVF